MQRQLAAYVSIYYNIGSSQYSYSYRLKHVTSCNAHIQITYDIGELQVIASYKQWRFQIYLQRRPESPLKQSRLKHQAFSRNELHRIKLEILAQVQITHNVSVRPTEVQQQARPMPPQPPPPLKPVTGYKQLLMWPKIPKIMLMGPTLVGLLSKLMLTAYPLVS